LWQKEKDKADEKMREKRERDGWKIAVGDHVWCRIHVRSVLQPRWEGPYEVVSVSEDGLGLTIRRIGGRKLRRVHRTQVKRDGTMTTTYNQLKTVHITEEPVEDTAQVPIGILHNTLLTIHIIVI